MAEQQKITKKTRKKIIGTVLALCFLVLFWFIIPPSEAMPKEALLYCGIFTAWLCTMIFQVCEMFVSGGIALVLLVLSGLYTTSEVLGKGFSSSTIWFIIYAYAFTTAVNKTGVFTRIVLRLLSVFPESFTGQVLALTSSAVIVNPMIPSGQAKIGIFAPIAEQVARQYNYPQHSKPAVGLFLSCWQQTAFQTIAWGTSTAYVLTSSLTGISTSFFGYIKLTGIWLAVFTVLWTIYVMTQYRPTDESMTVEKGSVKKKLEELGPMNKAEKIGGIILLITVALWMTESIHGISSMIVAVIAFAACALTGLMSGRDIGSSVPWSLVMGMFPLMTLSGGMREFGVDQFLINTITPYIGWISNPFIYVLFVIFIAYAIRQVSSDVSTCVIITFSALGPIGAALGIPTLCTAFAAFASTSIYNIKGISLAWLFADGASKGWIDYEDVRPSVWIYAAVNVIALLCCVPVWLNTTL